MTKQKTIFAQSAIESNCVVKIIMFGSLYVPKINSSSFPRFISNVSISTEDFNWKVPVFLHGIFWLI